MVDKTTKFTLALLVIGVVLIMLPSGPNGETIFSTFFGSQPWLTGLTGQITNPDGTTTQVTLIPADQVSFKMQLVASYEDGSSDTIFEKSTLPGLAVLAQGKPVKDVTARAVVAVALSKALPSSAIAKFSVNFTSLIHNFKYGCQLQPLTGHIFCIEPPLGFTPKVKWIYREVESPLVANGTLALVMLPAFKVLSGDVFPTAPGQNEDRRVDWNVYARVTITAPGYSPLSLIGDTGSFANFNFEGSITGGCTSCTTTTSPTGGGGIGGRVEIDDGGDDTTSFDIVTFYNPATCDAACQKNAQAPTGILGTSETVAVAQVNSVTVKADGTIIENVKYGAPDKTGTQRVTSETFSPSGGFRDAGSTIGTGGTRGAQFALIPYWRLDLAGSTVLVNQNFVIIILLAIAFLVGYSLKNRKS